MKEIDAGPIFIGGPDRCGKTSLQAFLVTHSNISIPDVGSNMWTYFYGQFGDIAKEENFERCLAAMLRYKHVRFLEPEPERIRADFRRGEPTYAELFAIFQRHHSQRSGKPRWGVQTGLIERYADPLFKAYPTAKIVHMIRDPRDRYQASLALWPDGKGRAGGATARWLYSVLLARRNLKKYPDRYKVVRFESLIRQPEATLMSICQFIGEVYEPEILTMAGAPTRRDRLLARATEKGGETPLSVEFIGNYRDQIDPADVAFMQFFMGRQMRALDYSLEAIEMRPSRWVRSLLIDWPLDVARMGGWLAIEWLQQHFPAQYGRKPDPRLVKAMGQDGAKIKQAQVV